MTQPPDTEDMKTSLPLLVPLWLLSILTGVVLTYSTFFGATLAIVVVAMLVYCLCRMSSAKKITVKAIETMLLLLLIPILGTASFMSSVYYPIATTTINVLLVSVALPHLFMVLLAGKITHFLLFFSAFLMLVVYPTGFYRTEISTFSTILPFITVTAFALVLMCRTTFTLRDKVPVRACKFTCLALAIICATASVYSYFYTFPRFAGSLVETIACTLLILYLDFLQYQMRTPFASWTEDTHCYAFAHVSVKFGALLIVIWWAALAPLLEFGPYHLSPSIKGGYYEDSQSFCLLMWGLAQHTIYACYFKARKHGRAKEYERSASPLSNTRVAVAASGCAVVIALKCAIAAYYILDSHPRFVPSIILLPLIGLLFLLLTKFLDDLKPFLAPFNLKLLLLCVGLVVYLLATLAYLDATAPSQDISNFNLKGANPTTGTIYNETIRQIAPLKDSKDEEKTPETMYNREGTTDQLGTFEMIRYPVMRICMVLCDLILLLVHYFIFAIDEEKERKEKSGSPNRETIRQTSLTTGSVSTATTTVTLGGEESINDAEAERQPMI